MENKQNEFKIPPVSAVIGSTIPNFFHIISMGKVAPKYILKLILTFLVILISTPFQIYEFFYYHRKVRKRALKKPPVFIVGHWRSGTTHLHNLMCKDPNHGYVTTYQGVFPNNMKSKWIFKTFMRLNIPEKRPSDNVKLSPDFPQEEEFAIGNMTYMTFYHFFYFPELNDTLYEKYVRFNGVSKREIKTFKRKYHKLLLKASINSGKEQLIVKNPANTGKIKLLLEMYPDAKFIHIYRNPVITYLSTVRFYHSLLPATSLQKYDDEYVVEKVIRNYKLFMKDFEEAKKLIPESNLFEIRYEDFEKDNLYHLKEIYNKLGLETWENAEPLFREYIQAQRHYKKNRYQISGRELERLEQEWGFAMEKFNYKIPENLEVHEN